MSGQPVSAVWFWRCNVTAFRAAYGRFPGSSTFSKDFLQASATCATVFDEITGRQPGESVPITWKWPGGEVKGHVQQGPDAALRLQFFWPYSDSPAPWRLNPGTDPIAIIPGTPGLPDEMAAEAQFPGVEAREPWLVAVQLAGELDVLHARAYLGVPPLELAHASVDTLPASVRDALRALPVGSGCGVLKAVPLDARSPELMREVLDALERSPNVLLVGPPGTGKTVVLEDIRRMYEAGNLGLTFDPDLLHGSWADAPTWAPVAVRTRSVVFHPSYSYEDFVVGLSPATGPGFSLEARPGPLISLAHWASAPGNIALLDIDEFNRGNAAAIFGDTIALLDNGKRSDPSSGVQGVSIDRAHASYPLDVPADFTVPTLGRRVTANLTLPRKLFIVAALNSSDRSVAPLDAALRRRFAIIRVGPDYHALSARLGVPEVVPPVASADVTTWTREDALALAVRLLRGLNARIELVLGEDFLLGHSLFWDVTGETVDDILRSLAIAFDQGVAGSLRLTFSDQDEALAAVLLAGPPPSDGVTFAVVTPIATWVVPEPRLAAVAAPRLRLSRAAMLSAPEVATEFLRLA